MTLMTIDLRENYYTEANRRFKAMLWALEYQSYLDSKDDGNLVDGQREYDEHFNWFEEHMPELLPKILYYTIRYFRMRLSIT